MLDWEQHREELRKTGAAVEVLAEAAFVEFMRRLKAAGYDNPRDILADILVGFGDDYTTELAAAMTRTLRKSISAESVGEIKIGKVTLKNKLIKDAAVVSADVERVIKKHVKGWQSINKLAVELYDGYTADKQVIEWSPRNRDLPLYIRDVLRDRPTQIQLAKITRRAVNDKIKTPALRAAYNELLAEVERGAGFNALSKKLNVALNERMRFQTNRIAQTELHRAWSDAQAKELLDNDEIEVVTFKLSSSHPATDICDVYAMQDLYGLGKGVYPKDKAPAVPLHPYCRCRLQGSLTKKADGAKHNPNAQKELMQSIAKQNEDMARKMAGSNRKLDLMLRGKSLESIYNKGKPEQYHIGREISSLDF